MQVSVLTTSNIERRLIIGVPSDVVDGNFQSKVKTYAKQARIDGFRPGKVPVSVVMQKYGKSIRRETISELIETYYVKALEQSELQPVSPPSIEKVIDEPGSDFKFEAVVEVWPEVSLPSMDKISVKVAEASISDEDIEKMVTRLQTEKATFSEASEDAAATEGMQVTVTFEGTIDGEVFEGGKGEGLSFVIGGGQMIPGFDEEVVGLKNGDTKTFSINFPADYGKAELAGQAAEFTVTVTKLEISEKPALDQEFFKQYESEAEDLKAFKEELRGNMERELELALTAKRNDNVLTALIEAINFKVPKGMIEQQASFMRDQALRNIGLKPEDYRKQFGTEMFEKDATHTVQKVVVLREMQKKFDLSVDDAALDAYLDKMSKRYDDPAGFIAKMKESDKNLERMKDEVLEQQLIDHVASLMTVESENTDYFSLMAKK